jgi:hypothetical protein
METKTHWKQLHNPDYLGAYSLMDNTGNYKDIIVKFKSIKKKEVKGEDGKDSECIVAEVHNNKPMILNATNCKMLTKLFSSPTVEDWVNKPVQLCVKKIKAFGDTVDALRVANKLPEPPQLPELTPQHEKWMGALTAMQEKNTTIEQIKKAYRISAENEKLLTAPK